MSFDLCQVKKAEKPYYIESIGIHIYTIEELCFYLYENIYLIDQTIINEALCDWLRDELGLKKLYRQLYEQLEKQEGIAHFVLPIFREIGYLSPEKMRQMQEKLGKLEVQPEDMRQKLKGDYLVKCGMYSNAMHEYEQILNRRGPGNLGAQFYAEIWNNLGCAYARMFLFEDAADCFLKGYRQAGTKELLRRYVSVLPLYLSDEEYRKKIKEVGADSQLVARIQEYNSKICRNLSQAEGNLEISREEAREMIGRIREDYCRSAKC